MLKKNPYSFRNYFIGPFLKNHEKIEDAFLRGARKTSKDEKNLKIKISSGFYFSLIGVRGGGGYLNPGGDFPDWKFKIR